MASLDITTIVAYSVLHVIVAALISRFIPCISRLLFNVTEMHENVGIDAVDSLLTAKGRVSSRMMRGNSAVPADGIHIYRSGLSLMIAHKTTHSDNRGNHRSYSLYTVGQAVHRDMLGAMEGQGKLRLLCYEPSAQPWQMMDARPMKVSPPSDKAFPAQERIIDLLMGAYAKAGRASAFLHDAPHGGRAP